MFLTSLRLLQVAQDNTNAACAVCGKNQNKDISSSAATVQGQKFSAK